MTVLILGGADDDHAVHMLDHLRRRGADAEIVDSRWFPARLRVRYDPVSTAGALQLPCGRHVDFHSIRSVYWRNYFGIGAAELPNPEQAYVAANDSRSLFESLLVGLRVRWVNGWNGFQLHQTKPAQLARATTAGALVPATLLANDAEAVLDFAARHPRSIFKPVQGGAHARRLTPEHLTPERLQNLALAPVTLQEEVDGVNVRVFVAGERVLACEIHSATLDYRDDPAARLTPCELPDDVVRQYRHVARALELVWAGIDLRRTAAGEYFFLEANPSPMFLGFEAATGLPLTESLTDLLLGG
jgi:glutathione synthase/RimK-type ligase-like ATP-grasp enzyme